MLSVQVRLFTSFMVVNRWALQSKGSWSAKTFTLYFLRKLDQRLPDLMMLLPLAAFSANYKDTVLLRLGMLNQDANIPFTNH